MSIKKKKASSSSHLWRTTATIASVVIKAALLCILSVAVVYAGRMIKESFPAVLAGVVSAQKSVLVSKQLLKCQEIIAVKYIYSDVVCKEVDYETLKVIKGTERVYVKVTVSVRAGIKDMNAARFAMSEDGEDIFVSLPPCVILGSAIESQEVLVEDRKMKTRITTNDVLNEIQNKKDDIVQQTLLDGILTDAEERTKQIVTDMLTAAGFKNITVFYDSADKDDKKTP